MLTDRETRIAQILESSYGERAARSFRGGIEVLDHTNEDRVSQSAHSLREVYTIIVDQAGKGGAGAGRGKKGKDGKRPFADKLAAATLRGPLPAPDRSIYKKVYKNREKLISIAHHRHPPTDDEYKTIVDEFVLLLEELLKPHFETLGEVERLMAIRDPTEDDLESLKTLLSKNGSLYAHFFQNAGPNWLPRLAAGYLQERPAGDEAAKQRLAADRLQAAYLARHAAAMPELASKLLAGLLERSSGSPDPLVQLHAMRAALAMPPCRARAIAGRIRPGRRGHPFNSSLAVQEAAELASRLAESGYGCDAVALAKVLLSVARRTRFVTGLFDDYLFVKGGVEPVIGEYFFGVVLKNAAPRMFAGAPLETVRLLVTCLARTVLLENLDLPRGRRDGDMSMYWRPAIEDHQQNHPASFKSELVGMLAELLLGTGKRSASDLRGILEPLAEKKYPVFRRLELYVYKNFPDAFAGEIADAVDACFDNAHLHHEYFHLLKARFPALPEAVRKKYLERVLDGPGDRYKERARRLEQEGRGPPAEAAVRHWKSRHLEPVKDCLSEPERRLVGDLAGERAGNHPDFVVHKTMGAGVRRSALVEGLEPGDAISAARSWSPGTPSIWDDDGTPGRFQEYCESNPEGYSARAAELAGLHPRLREVFFRGMKAVVDKEGVPCWEGVLGLCSSVIDSIKDGSASLDDEEQVVDAMASLLRSAMAEDRVPFQRRAGVWRLLEDMAALGEDQDRRVWEAQEAGAGGGAFMEALNAMGGTVFLAVYKYVAWCLKHGGKEARLAPEAKRLLEAYLDGKISNTPPKHALVGHMLALLYVYEKDWISRRIDDIFGGGRDRGALARAAWSGYLANDPEWSSFEDMAPLYRADMASKGRPSSDGASAIAYGEDLIRHVTQGYLLGMGDIGETFDDMVKRSDDDAKSHCAWVIYNILGAHKEDPHESFDSGRFREIWAGNALAPNKFLGEWVECSPLDPGETLGLLHKSLALQGGTDVPMLLTRKLQQFADGHPEAVLACLEAMVDDESLHEEIRMGKDDLPGIMGAIHGHAPSRARVAALADRLGEMGHNDLGGYGSAHD